jgi:hypothetical protein
MRLMSDRVLCRVISGHCMILEVGRDILLVFALGARQDEAHDSGDGDVRAELEGVHDERGGVRAADRAGERRRLDAEK